MSYKESCETTPVQRFKCSPCHAEHFCHYILSAIYNGFPVISHKYNKIANQGQ